MKRIDLPLWSDTVFLFFAVFLFFFCVFRFYLHSLWGALLGALAAAAAAAFLFFLFFRARRKKRHASEGEKEAGENADAGTAAAHGSEREYARIRGGRIDTEKGSTYLKFQFEKVTADELSPVIRAEGGQKTVLGAAFTDEAQKLAAAFGLRLKDAAEVYALVKESGCMPETLISPPEPKRGFRAKFAFRIRRGAWRGYLFSGVFLLLFSLFTIFPVYYIAAGGILLALAAAVRFFGKKD